jgi:N-acetylglucosamine kinase-like BadF-type ATPase
MRPALLALDGGGSKIDAVLLARTGRVVGAARRARSVYDSAVALGREDGESDDLEGVDAAVAAVCADAGLAPDTLPIADLGVYCVAGADFPSDDRRIARMLMQRGWTSEDIVLNDTFAVLRAGSDRRWGVAVVCGYGMNCSGVAPDGRTFRFPALGGISGDWGGGLHIGQQALWYAARAEDGRGDATALAHLVPDHFAMKRPRQVTEAMYFGRLAEERLAELPPIVFRAAADGDAAARSIVDRQADEVVAMAGAALRRLRLTHLDPDVVLGGGIFRNEEPVFFERMHQGLRSAAPNARVNVLTAPPVVGAALLGLDRLGAGRASTERVRAALTHDRLPFDPVTTSEGHQP